MRTRSRPGTGRQSTTEEDHHGETCEGFLGVRESSAADRPDTNRDRASKDKRRGAHGTAAARVDR